MANTVIALKKSSVPSSVPSSLANGELAINYADGKLFYRKADGSIAAITGDQNFYGSLNVDNTFIVADQPSDILTLISGSNITLTPDAINDTITISASGGGASVTTSDTAPVSPGTGDLWWNSSIGKLFVYYDDGTSVQWVETVPNYIYTPPLASGSDPYAFAQANVARNHANASFDQANLVFIHANNAYAQANTINAVANAAIIQANTTRVHANAAFNQANLAFAHANNAYDKANSALANTSGILFGGNLNVSGNLTANVLASSNGYIDLGPGNVPPYVEGRVYYDNVDKSLTVYNNVADFVLPLGQKEFVKVLNDTLSTIPKGAAVYATGYHLTSHHHITVDLADASDPNKYDVLGLVAADIAAGDHGYVIVRGWLGGIDTSNLTVDQRFHLGYNSPGSLVTVSPEYPNYPFDIGYCIVSNTTNGFLYVDRQSHTLEGLRVLNSARVGGDMFIEGDLTVLGTQNQVSVDSLSVGTQFVYLGAGDSITSATFTGTGLNDLTFKGHYEDTGTKNYYVKISATSPDKFSWSYVSDFSVLQAENVSIQFQTTQPLANGIGIYFNANTGHTLNDKWNASVTGVSTDFGFIGSHVNGPNGYTHSGIFRDATDGTYRFFNSHDPEISTVVDIGDPSYTYANVEVKRITAAEVYEGATRISTVASDALSAAVAGITHANQAFSKANTANITADLAFTHANNAYLVANTSGDEAAAAFSRANITYAHANAAFNKANTVNVRSTAPLNIYVGTTAPTGNNIGDIWIDTN